MHGAVHCAQCLISREQLYLYTIGLYLYCKPIADIFADLSLRRAIPGLSRSGYALHAAKIIPQTMDPGIAQIHALRVTDPLIAHLSVDRAIMHQLHGCKRLENYRFVITSFMVSL